MHEVDRHPVDGSESAVDATDKLIDGRAEVLVLLDVLPRRNGDLDKDDLSDPLGVLLEEDLHGVELLRDTLDVVETVDTDDELDALEATAEGRDALLNFLLLEGLVELARLDTDRERADRGVAADELDAVRGALEAEKARARRDEVAGVVVGVEADEVAVEDTEEDLAADGEGAAEQRRSARFPLTAQRRPTHRKTSELGKGVWRK